MATTVPLISKDIFDSLLAHTRKYKEDYENYVAEGNTALNAVEYAAHMKVMLAVADSIPACIYPTSKDAYKGYEAMIKKINKDPIACYNFCQSKLFEVVLP